MYETKDNEESNQNFEDRESLTKKAYCTSKSPTNDLNSCAFTKLSKFVYSILTSKLNIQNSKNDHRKDEESIRIEFKSKMFEKIFQDCNDAIDVNQTNTFKQKKFAKLLNLFQNCENYYSTMMLNVNYNDNCEIQSYSTDISHSNVHEEFYFCGLCFHYLCDPITLVCGCSFCKLCLDEYNQSQFQIAVLKQYNEPSKHLFRCRTCGFSHNQNSSQNLSTNVFISKIIEKTFSNQIETRFLRNDIRKCIYLKIIDYDKAVTLLERVYTLDETNHLILVDLFFLNFFNQSYDKCFAITDKLFKIIPFWPLTRFIRSLCYQLKEDFNNMSMDLISCLELDSNLEYVKAKLYKLSAYLKNNDSDNSMIEEYFQAQANQSNKDYEGQNDSDEVQNVQDKMNVKISGDDLKSNELNEFKIRMNSSMNVIRKNIKTSDVECSLCYRLLYKPVSTPCGHVFCCACLDRSLDHQDKCPLCKRSLSDYLAERRQSTTNFLEKIIKECFPDEHNERKLQYEDELADLIKNDHEIPIFVCTLALPGVKCPLHIYEPRYRLMLRRALATTKQFGMCVYLENNEYASFGCMLEVKKAQFLRDGRALIDTIGGRRFKVIRRSIKDGYNIADVEWLRDIKINDLGVLSKLNKEVYELACQWFEQLPNEQKAKILESFGISQIPNMEDNIEYSDNGPDWHWFLLHILPLDTEFQLKFLSTTSLMARLSQLKMILRILLKSCEKENSNSKSNDTNSQHTSVKKENNNS